ncbi:glycoside hydrolase family 15 protein [Cytophagaceae bacterium YF14B1]|uniref:Glycoside hydrolase family 15 protein n=1 Tax=Xanthocytophaga flava TaxID=3048013 RepID=A0AAE3U8S2_9BACT|nr:glycoside hydrolase family 15 protein [Xanthocytophaga flavus]MDJ1481473.1 glycoside hydrolase family 15 protein [Xanthocytophaga flavus]
MEETQAQDYQPLENYGIIGNQATVALVGLKGSIDFMSFPRYDSPTIFAALLDKDKGGRFQIVPQLNNIGYKQMYLPDTNVLLTRFLSYEGLVEITDFMPIAGSEYECTLIRKVMVVRGEVKIRMDCCPRFNYARTPHTAYQRENQIIFKSEEDNTLLRLVSDCPLQLNNGDASAELTLHEKEVVHFVFQMIPREEIENDLFKSKELIGSQVDKAFLETVHYWKDWTRQSAYKGRWADMVNRSALVLKMLTSRKYGSPIAAATLGLPEAVGGIRNWDYRYTWIRDAAFTMYAFIRLGFTKEAGDFMRWIRKQFEKNIEEGGGLQLMYAVDGTADLHEEELTHLEGYFGSKPVRIGNNAHNQLQLDIYGELIDSIYLYDKYGEAITYDFWQQLCRQIEYVCQNWNQKDHSIWEIRSEMKDFLYSRVMCWVAVDRGIRLAESHAFPYPFEKWRTIRTEIFEDIYHNFWNEDRKAFVQYKGGDVLDAAALIMPLVRIISPYDPRWVSTLEAIENELVSDTLVYRYNTEHFEDGVGGGESTFSMCSFWYVECLARGGQLEKARLYFEKMMGYANHLGLYAEQIGLRGEQLGNYPQAFTHLGLISAAHYLNRALEKSKI